MQTEYEAKFLDIDKDEVRNRLKKAGATMTKAEYLQKRWVFDLPQEKHTKDVFVRVRDEGGKITMTWKRFSDTNIGHPGEIEIDVSNFDSAVELLTELGCRPASYQENYREWWKLDDIEITIDSWPFYAPFVEIEGPSEEAIEKASKSLGFEWSQALFCGVSKLFQMKYGPNVHIREMPRLTFEMPNPFV